MKKLLVLAGDGIGPEVTGEALRVIDWFATRRRLDIEISEALFGGASFDRHGVFITEQTMAATGDRPRPGPAGRLSKRKQYTFSR